MSAFRRIYSVSLRSLLVNTEKKTRLGGLIYNNSNRIHYRYLSQDSFRDKLKKIVDYDSSDKVENKKDENVSNDNVVDSNTKSSENGDNNIKNSSDNNSNSENISNSNTETSNTNINKLPSFNIGDIFGNLKDNVVNSYYFLDENIRLAWKEMTNQDQPSKIQKKVVQASSYKPVKKDDNDSDHDKNDDEKEEEIRQGGSEIVLVKDRGTAWDQMKARLQDSPIIKELYKRSKKLQDVAASTDIGKQAFQAGQNIKDKISDVREFWETSQNPIVYTVSGIVENITGQTEEGICLTEFKKLDPDFILEDWADEIKKQLVPVIIKAHLVGDTKTLKPWLGEACYKKLCADIGARKADGLTFDSNIIEIDENKISCSYLEERGYPVIQAVYAVQIINCVKNRKGEIVEGGETQVKQRFYVMIFQQCYIEETGSVQWKIADYMLAGDLDFY